jgi:hypothetical protein
MEKILKIPVPFYFIRLETGKKQLQGETRYRNLKSSKSIEAANKSHIDGGGGGLVLDKISGDCPLKRDVCDVDFPPFHPVTMQTLHA